MDRQRQLAGRGKPASQPVGRRSLHARLAPCPAPGSEPLRPAPRPLVIDNIGSTDPLNGRPRDLAFLLDSRLEADGVLILHNGRILAERYRNGLRAEQPRLLLQATRPLLNVLGAISLAQGKLAADKSVNRYIPALNAQTGTRKLSIQRLLEGEERYNWTPEELESWRQAGGWTSAPSAAGIRPWLSQKGLWDKPLVEAEAPVPVRQTERRPARLDAQRKQRDAARPTLLRTITGPQPPGTPSALANRPARDRTR
jgi:hypothetical protein